MLAAILVLELVSSFGVGAGGPLPSMNPTLRSAMQRPVLPSEDNQCGRTVSAYLAPIAGTHVFPPYPAIAMRHAEEGDTQIAVVVNADGKASDVHVARSSGFADLDEAAMAAVRKYEWQKPGRACRQMGVQQLVNVDWTFDLPTITIAANSSDYPAAAKAANLSGVGTVLVSQTGDTVTAIKLGASTGAPALDNAMLDFARTKITLPSLMRDDRALSTTMLFLVRFNGDPARPGTVLTPNLPDSVMDLPS